MVLDHLSALQRIVAASGLVRGVGAQGIRRAQGSGPRDQGWARDQGAGIREISKHTRTRVYD
jgi:hypothetical protein